MKDMKHKFVAYMPLIIVLTIGGLVIGSCNLKIITYIDNSRTIVDSDTFNAKITDITYGYEGSSIYDYYAYLHLENGTIAKAYAGTTHAVSALGLNNIVLNATYQITTETNGWGKTYVDHLNLIAGGS